MGVLSLALIAAVGAAWLAHDRHVNRQQWEAYRTAALQRGVKLSFAENLPSPTPSKANAAMLKAFSSMPGGEQAGSVLLKFNLAATAPGSDKTALGQQIESLQKAMISEKWLPEETATQEPARAVLQGLERFAPALAEFRAANGGGRLRFPVDSSPPPQTKFDLILPCLNLAKICSLRAHAHLALGQLAEALADVQDISRLWRSMDDQPALMSGLSRLAVLGHAMRSMETGLRVHGWSDAELQGLQRRLSEIDLVADAQAALASERGFDNDAFETMRGMPVSQQMKNAEQDGFETDEQRGVALWWKLLGGTSYLEQIEQNRLVDDRLARLGKDWDFAFAAPVFQSSSGERFARIVDGVLQRYAALEMTRRENLAVCALERWRLQHGGYPEDLKLPADFSGDLPKDVFTGEPLHYERLAPDQFRLYGIGPNGRDDQGSTAFDQRLTGACKALDWVWGEPWK